MELDVITCLRELPLHHLKLYNKPLSAYQAVMPALHIPGDYDLGSMLARDAERFAGQVDILHYRKPLLAFPSPDIKISCIDPQKLELGVISSYELQPMKKGAVRAA